MPSTRWACVTELESVNILLAVIGEAPISQMSDIQANEIDDAALAQRTLSEVNRDVQAEGWTWNIDRAVRIEVGLDDGYVLPGNTLRTSFSPNRYGECQYVARGLRIWDKDKRTYKFGDSTNPQPLIVDELVTQLEWDELSHAAQYYITIRASRIYAERYVNSNLLYTYSVQDEEAARGQLIRAEESSLSNNLLWGNDRGMTPGVGYVPSQGRLVRYN